MLNNTIELYNKTLYNHSNTISNNAPNNVAVSFIPIAVGSIIGLAAKSIAMYITNSVTARIACYKKTYFALNIIQNTNTGNEIEINSIKNIKSELLTSSTKSIYSLSSGSMIAGIYSLEKALFPTSSDTNKQSELAIHLMLSSLSFLAINFSNSSYLSVAKCFLNQTFLKPRFLSHEKNLVLNFKKVSVPC